MTDREMKIMEDHTRALQANTKAMEQLLPLLGVLCSKKYMDAVTETADVTMHAARKMENAVQDFMGTTKKLIEASEKNEEAARRMSSAAEQNLNAAYMMRNN